MPDKIAGGYSATVKKRSLGRLLIRLREEAGFKFTEVCKRTGLSPTTLTSMEKATWVTPNSDHVRVLLDLYGVKGRPREETLQIAFEARERGWWRAKRYLGVFANELPGYEQGAAQINTYSNIVLHGIIQSPAYVDEVTRSAGIDDPDEVARHREARLERQWILTRPESPVVFHAIIDENAIARIPEVAQREQISQLIAISESPNVTIQVVPTSAGVYAGSGEPFTHLEFAEAEFSDLIYLETSIDDRFLEEDEEVESFKTRFRRLTEAALDLESTRTFLRQQIE